LYAEWGLVRGHPLPLVTESVPICFRLQFLCNFGQLLSGLAPAVEGQSRKVLVGLEEEARDVGHEEQDQVAVDAEHILVVREVKAERVVRPRHCDGPRQFDVPFFGQECPGGEDHTGDDSDVAAFSVGPGGEETEDEEACYAAGDDGVQAKDGPEDALVRKGDIGGGYEHCAYSTDNHDNLAEDKSLPVGAVWSCLVIVVLHDDGRQAVEVGVEAGQRRRHKGRQNQAGYAYGELIHNEIGEDPVSLLQDMGGQLNGCDIVVGPEAGPDEHKERPDGHAEQDADKGGLLGGFVRLGDEEPLDDGLVGAVLLQRVEDAV